MLRPEIVLERILHHVHTGTLVKCNNAKRRRNCAGSGTEQSSDNTLAVAGHVGIQCTRGQGWALNRWILATKPLLTRHVPKCERHFKVAPSKGGPRSQVSTLELILI
ncbi:hypothetical protein TNCV_5040131 [Trichonephila clavipes]|nr:hypothetical protein TNCV_5040131 [Trichonephila clavipes]